MDPTWNINYALRRYSYLRTCPSLFHQPPILPKVILRHCPPPNDNNDDNNDDNDDNNDDNDDNNDDNNDDDDDNDNNDKDDDDENDDDNDNNDNNAGGGRQPRRSLLDGNAYVLPLCSAVVCRCHCHCCHCRHHHCHCRCCLCHYAATCSWLLPASNVSSRHHCQCYCHCHHRPCFHCRHSLPPPLPPLPPPSPAGRAAPVEDGGSGCHGQVRHWLLIRRRPAKVYFRWYFI